MENKENKIYYVEVLRAVSALAVVALHVASVNWFGYIGSFNWIVFTIVSGFMRFSVPVFFMLSGALFLRKDKQVPLKKIYMGHIAKMAVFLVFWASVYEIYHLLAGQAGGNSLWGAAKSIIKGDTEVHLWFVYVIIGLYILIPVLKVFTDHADRKQLLYAIALAFVTAEFLPLLMRKTGTVAEVIMNNYNRLNISGLGGYVCLFLLGHYFHTYDIPKKARYVIYALGILGAATIISMTLYLCIRDNTLHETYFSFLMPMMPSVILWSAAVYVFGKHRFIKEGKLAGLARWVSNLSLGIYGVHMLVIFVLQKLGLSTLSFNALASVPVMFVAVAGISGGIVWVLKRIPLLGKYVC